MIKQVLSLPGQIFQNRRMIYKLAGNDFRQKFAGSYLGIIWAFIQPVVTVMVYWFVFTVGFKSSDSSIPVPFVLYLVAGIIPWFFFQDALSGGTNALLEYSYLVKKVVFRIEVLPVVKLISALFVHLVFLVFVTILYCFYGRYPDWYYLQLIYYTFGLSLLTLGLCYATSAVVVFFRDLSQVITIVLQVGIWITPIMWVADSLAFTHPAIYQALRLNPVYYIVSGYRDVFIYKRWFWEEGAWTLWFWFFTAAVFLFGTWMFGRLKDHFADVL